MKSLKKVRREGQGMPGGGGAAVALVEEPGPSGGKVVLGGSALVEVNFEQIWQGETVV